MHTHLVDDCKFLSVAILSKIMNGKKGLKKRTPKKYMETIWERIYEGQRFNGSAVNNMNQWLSALIQNRPQEDDKKDEKAINNRELQRTAGASIISTLVHLEDIKKNTTYTIIILKKFVIVPYEYELDIVRKIKFENGYPGIECLHCGGRSFSINSGRFSENFHKMAKTHS